MRLESGETLPLSSRAYLVLARGAGIEFVVEYRDEAVGFLDGGTEDAEFVANFFGDR
jgi:hypothetical protein